VKTLSLKHKQKLNLPDGFKKCKTCQEILEVSLFGKDKNTKDGINSQCKTCNTNYTKKHFAKNSVAKKASLERIKQWGIDNPHLVTAKAARYRAAKLNRMLKWGKEKLKPEIDTWYRRAQLATLFMGEPYEVDHIEPLQGKDRSGLHVPWNLQLLTKLENSSKGNRVKTNQPTPVSTRFNSQSKNEPPHRAVFAVRAGQDTNSIDHHSGTIRVQDVDHRTQADSGDSVGHGGQEMGTPMYPEGFKDPWID
jgi:hypothetical protein